MTEDLRQTYPRTTRLGDLQVTFRKMVAADRGAMLAFTRSLPEQDLLFLRWDITRGEVVDEWIRFLADGRTVTLVAEDAGRIVGYCSLHRSDILWTRHLGEVRLLVGSSLRGKGLGGALARQLLAIAKTTGLHKLVAQMMTTQRDAQSLFHHLGFIPEASLHDWAIDRNGRTHDLIVMSREVDDVEPHGDPE